MEKIEDRIKAEMGDKCNRNTFESFVMGYAVRTDRYPWWFGKTEDDQMVNLCL